MQNKDVIKNNNNIKKIDDFRNENLEWKNPFIYISTKRVKLLWALLVNFEYAIEFDISF